MAADEGRSRSFPTLPGSAWWGVRSRFQRSLPATVDPQYVEAVLGVQPKTARNITAGLRGLRLIDNDGKPTPLANEWRTDDGYANACESIINDVYPAALRDVVPPDEPDEEAAARWFVRERQVGTAAAGQMARLYGLIAARDVSGAEKQRVRGESGATERTRQTNRNSREQSRTTQTERKERQEVQPALPEDNRPSSSPSLHIDVQVHIPSDATTEQIDSIFASMAKHLYQQS